MYTSFDVPPGFLPSQGDAAATPQIGTSEQALPLSSTGQSSVTTTEQDAASSATSPAVGIMRWVIAWAVVILILSLINRSRLGHTVIYYALALMLFLLLVTQYKWLANILEPITGKNDTAYVGPQEEKASGDLRGHSWNIPQIAQSESAGIQSQ